MARDRAWPICLELPRARRDIPRTLIGARARPGPGAGGQPGKRPFQFGFSAHRLRTLPQRAAQGALR